MIQYNMTRDWRIKIPEHVEIYDKAKPFLQTRFNTIHTKIAYHFALTLIEKKSGDPKIIVPAILLHDIGWSKIPEERHMEAFGLTVKVPALQRLHETEGAKMAEKILNELKFSDDRIHEIKKIISGHDTRSESFNKNDEIVRDADRLWRYSHEGFTIDYQRFENTKRDHLVWLVESIPKWFPSQTSRSLAHKEAKQRKEWFGIDFDWISL